MNKYDDMQQILDLLADYTNKYGVDSKKHKEVYNSILSLTTTTPATTKTNKTTKNKKATNDKTDIYDTWNKLIKNGMQQI